jgi:predicted NBD/HSP70 family sugar kinase
MQSPLGYGKHGGTRGVSFEDVVAQWRTRPDASRAVEDAARLLGQALANVVAISDPALIVLTGRLAACGDSVADPIRQTLKAGRPLQQDPPRVVVRGPETAAGQPREFEWVGVRGAGRLAVELNTSAEDPPRVL